MAQFAWENSDFARRVAAAADRCALSHAIILSGTGDRLSAARYIAAAHLCRAAHRPCLSCNTCRKVIEGIHPDVITVQDEQRRELAVDDMRALKRDVYVRPNEAERKVYLFADCAQLNERDQNVLLKIVEEGPPYAAFIFCTQSAHALLPTVRSRCVEWKLREEDDAPVPEESAVLCRVLGSGDAPALAVHLASLETGHLQRQALQPVLLGAWRIAAEALLARRGKAPDPALAPHTGALGRLNDRQLRALADTLRRGAGACDDNAGVGHVLGALLAEVQQEVFDK